MMQNNRDEMLKKEKKIKKVIARWKDCEKCILHKKRKQVVFWRGNVNARIALLGEAPGAVEDQAGEPFRGLSGKLLDGLLDRAGLEPWDIFACNIVGCHPPKNRTPLLSEIDICKIRMFSMLRIVKPEVLLLLGGTALYAMTGVKLIAKERGKIYNVTYEWKNKKHSIRAIPTFHPAYLLRNRREELKRVVISDINKAIEISQDGSYLER